jgi:hypothetical protein
MLGYYKNPEETQKTIVDGWLYTGDIGYADGNGYFYITDRKKELIIVGGFNVFPREIDELIYKHPKVKEGITVGLPDPRQGERIKVYIILKEGETATPEEFIAYFRERLTPYKVPSEVEFRTELAKSMIGKILRRALREEEMSATNVIKYRIILYPLWPLWMPVRRSTAKNSHRSIKNAKATKEYGFVISFAISNILIISVCGCCLTLFFMLQRYNNGKN